MSQAPNYGWCVGSPGQAGFSGPGPAPGFNQQPFAPMGQAYCTTMNQPAAPYMGPTNTALGMGWQQGFGSSPGGLGFASAPTQPVPMSSSPGVMGFGFSANMGSVPPMRENVPPAVAPFSSQPAVAPFSPQPAVAPFASQPAVEPSAPPAPPPSSPPDLAPTSLPDGQEKGCHSPVETKPSMDSHSKVINVTPNRKPDRPPPPKVAPATNPSSANSTLNTSASDGEDRRNTSQYKEALQNMAALMTDVDLTDDVMNDLKQRFDLK